MNKNDIIIIGAGPAGISAALQLRKFGLNPLIIEMGSVGGLLRNANKIENYPGFPGGISGLDLSELFKEQLDKAGLVVNNQEVQTLDYKDDTFFVKTTGGEYTCKYVFIATGTVPKKLTNLNLLENFGKIYYDVSSFESTTGKKFYVIGSGDIAFDYALTLSRKNDVTILNRGMKIKANILLEKEVLESKISYFENSDILKVTDVSDGLSLDLSSSGTEKSVKTDYLVIAVGRIPAKGFYSNLLVSMELELFKAGRLYLIGDVTNSSFRQAAIAAGDGVKAVMRFNEKIVLVQE
ncbi:NAD(P)/FAD-dependent oxidoreductase [Candidatus Dependentiae bacterium]|nr:NAD(P)/FAD-dependent oxidoreductase [Candidatus Dependentiae bacterium]